MAVIHKASISPTKMEMIEGWLPSQPWFRVSSGPLSQVGAFRFDDPDGEVGVQVIIVRAGDAGATYQVPMTYRAAPLDGAEAGLMGEMAHSVLGTRYIYDACHDPVFVGELVRAVLTGGAEVDEEVEVDGVVTVLPKSMHVLGSGNAVSAVPSLGALDVTTDGDDGSVAVVRTAGLEVRVLRVLTGADDDTAAAATLTGTWPDGSHHCLATVGTVSG